jgi:hypothetical protein
MTVLVMAVSLMRSDFRFSTAAANEKRRSDDVRMVEYAPVVLGAMKGREGFLRIAPGELDRSRERRKDTRNPSPKAPGQGVTHLDG